ncbi:MAG TPA: dihydrofolate reductase family protein [Thermomicrobiales bacterium]|jgi:dihydrofolate reductase
MRKIVAGLLISLDGVVEAPDKWHFPYFNDEMGAAIGASIGEGDCMLLGRVTYEEFAGFWPNQSPDDPFTGIMNNTPKYVVSTTLNQLDWQNSTLINGNNLVEEITKLKNQPGKNINITGSGTLVRSLLREGLLDELTLFLHPIVVGTGKRLFPEGYEQTPLKLANSSTFSTGVLNLTYVPAGTEGELASSGGQR